MSQTDGVTSNHTLLTIINDLHGKDVVIELRDGNVYSGLFAACSPGLEIGLRYAFIKDASNEKNLLPLKSETTEKMVFNFQDIVAVSCLMNDEKKVKGFATDREYHQTINGADDELQKWEDEGDDYQLEPQTTRSTGWSVNEMFKANTQLGVTTNFDEDMRQYTNAEVAGTDEDRERANMIAREIETNSKSQYHAALENDDVERDLDTTTAFDEVVSHDGKRDKHNNNKGNNGRNNNMAPNRRDNAKGMNDRGRGGPSNRGYNNSNQYSQQRSQQHYIPGQNKRPTGAELQEQYNEFENKEAARKDQKGEYKSHNKVLLENANRNDKSNNDRSGSKPNASRVNTLYEWRKNTNIKVGSPEKEVASGSPAKASAPAGNAWNKGPPTSLLGAAQPPGLSPSPVPNYPSVPSDPQTNVETTPNVNNKDHVREPAHEEHPVDNHKVEAGEEGHSEANEEKEGSTSGKKFSFNVNAPAFTPRMTSTTPTSAAPPITQPIPNMTGIIGAVSAPMQMQAGMVPQNMYTSVQTPMMVPMPQGYTPVQYPAGQYMMPGGVPMIQAQRGANTTNVSGMTQTNQRRQGGPASQQVMVNQWGPPVLVPAPSGVQSYYQGYIAGGAPGQQQYGAAAIIPHTQVSQQQYAGQRFLPQSSASYVMQPQTVGQAQMRYQQTQQNQPSHHEGPYQGNQQHNNMNNSGNPGSQPPTPGPQPSASPAQPSNQGRGSPSSNPPQMTPQQQYAGAQQHMMSQPFYQQHQNMMMYGGQPMVISYAPMQHGMTHPDAHHMDGNMMPPNQNVVMSEQYANYAPPVSSAYYQQHQQMQGAPNGPPPQQSQPMSRQNSVPQSVYPPQGSPPGMQQQNQSAQAGMNTSQ